MAKASGLNVCKGITRSGINKRDVLLLDRFDVEKVDNHYTRKNIKFQFMPPYLVV
jgi:hypothetical protein